MDDVPFEGTDQAPEDGAPEFTESALALQFAERHQHKSRFVAQWNKWMRWNGSVWRHEQTLLASTEPTPSAEKRLAR